MAQLFQPTNIIPDLRGAFGNGVVNFLTTSIPVTWQVNGTTPMTAFEIAFYKNDGSGDQLYTTGKLTDGCPFYGMDELGNIQYFTYNVSTSGLTQAGMSNGNEYQMRITQYWDAGGEQSVIQTSPSVFLGRGTPTIWLETDDGRPVQTAVYSRYANFVARHTNPSTSGSLSWIRWRLMNGDGEIIKDTGKLYGLVKPTFSYDAFFPGDYYLKFSCETEYGVYVDGSWFMIPVVYDATPTEMMVTAQKACDGESAVLVQWPMIAQIPLASSTGAYSSGENRVTLSGGASMTWNRVNGQSMNISPEWSVLWKGILYQNNDAIFDIQTTGGHLVLSCYPGGDFSGDLTIIWQPTGGEELFVYASIVDFGGGEMFVGVTPTTLYFYLSGGADGMMLEPSEELFPGDSVYPKSDEFSAATILRETPDNTDYADQSITSVTVTGPQTTEYLKIVDHDVTLNEIQEKYIEADSVSYDAGTEFMFSALGSDYDAGNYYLDLSDLTAIALYRKQISSGLEQLVGQFPLGSVGVMDYGAASQQGPYEYNLYIVKTNTFDSTPSKSNQVSPCFWNWDLLSCTLNEDGTYSVVKSYLFGKNLSSGSVTNGNRPNVLNNFSQYPLVQLAPQNYKSGTLQSLIGTIDYSDGQNTYSDTIDLRDEIYALSTTTNALFLKNRKGDILSVRVSGEISMETMDNTREQAQNVSLPWVEVGSADGVSIYKIVT